MMIVRRERAADTGAVRDVVTAAFQDPAHPHQSPIETHLLDRLRKDEGWLPALSMVALDPVGDEVVGHVVCTRGRVGAAAVLGLGPLAVRPDRQRRGVGTALVHAVLGAAEALHEPLVALLGDPAYYQRFGFSPAIRAGVIPPEPQWGDAFQVRLLSAGPAPTGRFRYAEPFHDL